MGAVPGDLRRRQPHQAPRACAGEERGGVEEIVPARLAGFAERVSERVGRRVAKPEASASDERATKGNEGHWRIPRAPLRAHPFGPDLLAARPNPQPAGGSPGCPDSCTRERFEALRAAGHARFHRRARLRPLRASWPRPRRLDRHPRSAPPEGSCRTRAPDGPRGRRRGTTAPARPMLPPAGRGPGSRDGRAGVGRQAHRCHCACSRYTGARRGHLSYPRPRGAAASSTALVPPRGPDCACSSQKASLASRPRGPRAPGACRASAIPMRVHGKRNTSSAVAPPRPTPLAAQRRVHRRPARTPAKARSRQRILLRGGHEPTDGSVDGGEHRPRRERASLASLARRLRGGEARAPHRAQVGEKLRQAIATWRVRAHRRAAGCVGDVERRFSEERQALLHQVVAQLHLEEAHFAATLGDLPPLAAGAVAFAAARLARRMPTAARDRYPAASPNRFVHRQPARGPARQWFVAAPWRTANRR